MYCFLGIVAEQDQQKGDIVPSFILCQSHGTSKNRSGWRVMRQDDSNAAQRNMPKVLVQSLIGNEVMIDFLTNYRTRDHMHGDKRYKHESTKKYYPKGALFWFECNQYGEPTGTAIFIETVPRKIRGPTDNGFARLKEAQSKKIPFKEPLCRQPDCEENPYTCIKPKASQGR